MHDGDIGSVRRDGGQPLAGERTGDVLDARIDLWQVNPEIAAENGARQPGGARLVGVGHGGVGMLLDCQRMRPAVLDCVAQPMQRSYSRIAAPGEYKLLGAAHADELVVEEIGGHLDQGQPAPLLADDLMAGSIRNEMGEPLHCHGIAVPDAVLHGFGQGQETRHQSRVRGWNGLDYLRGTPGGVKWRQRIPPHHARPCAGHPRLATCSKTWMPGKSPAMTKKALGAACSATTGLSASNGATATPPASCSTRAIWRCSTIRPWCCSRLRSASTNTSSTRSTTSTAIRWSRRGRAFSYRPAIATRW